jgi:heme a synthase
VLGGLVVLFDVRPEFVMSHFLLSMVLLADAVVLYKRAGEPHTKAELQVQPRVRDLGRVLLVLAAIVVISGTVVTSTGPHGGDEKAKRFDLDLEWVARVHGTLVILFLALILVTLAVLRRTRAPEPVQSRLGAVLLVACVQGAIGYIQYFNGTPALLVGFHIAGATALWAAVLWYYLGLFVRPAEAAAPEGTRDASALLPA